MGNDFRKLPGVHDKDRLDRRLYEGTFAPPSRISDPLAPCPSQSSLSYGLRAHRLRWQNDRIAVCRDCGGVYEEET